MSPRAKQLRLFVVLLSLLVFVLALNAKLSLYEQPLHANATNSSKLWLNGQKMEAQTPATLLVLAVLPVAFIVLRLRFHVSPWPKVPIRVSVPSSLNAFEVHRFLRPPPIF